jgi:hypothetical protein
VVEEDDKSGVEAGEEAFRRKEHLLRDGEQVGPDEPRPPSDSVLSAAHPLPHGPPDLPNAREPHEPRQKRRLPNVRVESSADVRRQERKVERPDGDRRRKLIDFAGRSSHDEIIADQTNRSVRERRQGCESLARPRLADHQHARTTDD